MALAVPLSRFTSRVGGGSAFFVRRHFMRYLFLICFGSAVLATGCASHSSVGEPSRVTGSTEPGVYIIQPGDGWPTISSRFHLTTDQFWALNPGVDVLHIPMMAGQKVFVSGVTNK